MRFIRAIVIDLNAELLGCHNEEAGFCNRNIILNRNYYETDKIIYVTLTNFFILIFLIYLR